jgi:hypothetical protein
LEALTVAAILWMLFVYSPPFHSGESFNRAHQPIPDLWVVEVSVFQVNSRTKFPNAFPSDTSNSKLLTKLN